MKRSNATGKAERFVGCHEREEEMRPGDGGGVAVVKAVPGCIGSCAPISYICNTREGDWGILLLQEAILDSSQPKTNFGILANCSSGVSLPTPWLWRISLGGGGGYCSRTGKFGMKLES